METYEAIVNPENIPLMRQIEAELTTMKVPSLMGKVKGKHVLVQCSGSTCTAIVVDRSAQPKNKDIETTREAPKVIQALLDDIKWQVKG